MPAQLVKKASQSSPPQRRKIEIIFCRGVYVAENTLRLANVGVVCFQQTTSALRQAAAFCRKAPKGFFDSLNRHSRMICYACKLFYKYRHLPVDFCCKKVCHTN